jgi:dihydrofolate reductase
MRQLLVNTFLTVDGVMQAPGGPGENWDGGVDHGGWSTGYFDDRVGEVMGEITGRPFDLLLGRRTYEVFAAHWPNTGSQVLSCSTTPRSTWRRGPSTGSTGRTSILIKGDVADYVRTLKASDGPEIQVHGSANLIQTLLKHDLVDVFSLLTFPIVLGSGKRLFADGTIPAGLEVVDVKTSPTGVIAARYERAGDINYGSFAGEEATEVRKKLASEG